MKSSTRKAAKFDPKKPYTFMLAGAPVGQDEGLHKEGRGLRGGHRHEAARLRCAERALRQHAHALHQGARVDAQVGRAVQTRDARAVAVRHWLYAERAAAYAQNTGGFSAHALLPPMRVNVSRASDRGHQIKSLQSVKLQHTLAILHSMT